LGVLFVFAFIRQLLPSKGEAFSDKQLEALLAGNENFHFGNPTAKMWQDCLSGKTSPAQAEGCQ
jgi:hypothetical protein